VVNGHKSAADTDSPDGRGTHCPSPSASSYYLLLLRKTLWSLVPNTNALAVINKGMRAVNFALTKSSSS